MYRGLILVDFNQILASFHEGKGSFLTLCSCVLDLKAYILDQLDFIKWLVHGIL